MCVFESTKVSNSCCLKHSIAFESSQKVSKPQWLSLFQSFRLDGRLVLLLLVCWFGPTLLNNVKPRNPTWNGSNQVWLDLTALLCGTHKACSIQLKGAQMMAVLRTHIPSNQFEFYSLFKSRNEAPTQFQLARQVIHFLELFLFEMVRFLDLASHWRGHPTKWNCQ